MYSQITAFTLKSQSHPCPETLCNRITSQQNVSNMEYEIRKKKCFEQNFNSPQICVENKNNIYIEYNKKLKLA